MRDKTEWLLCLVVPLAVMFIAKSKVFNMSDFQGITLALLSYLCLTLDSILSRLKRA